MTLVTIRSIVQTSIVTAFTIAAALIWKDVITEFIESVVPAGNTLMYKFIAAVVATLLVIVAIYVLLETEQEAEKVFRRFKNGRRIKNR